VGEVGEEGLGRLNPGDGGQGLFDVHVGEVRLGTKSIDDEDLKTLEKREA
jgi:hypothetical protein